MKEINKISNRIRTKLDVMLHFVEPKNIYVVVKSDYCLI